MVSHMTPTYNRVIAMTSSKIGCLIVVLCIGWMAAPSLAIEAAGHGSDLWVVQPVVKDELLILHRSASDPAGVLRPAFDSPLKGRLAPGGLASSQNRLWLVYQGRNPPVQSIRRESAQEPYGPTFKTYTHYSLPSGVVLRYLTADTDMLWALVRVDEAQTLQELDHPPSMPAPDDDDSANASEEDPTLGAPSFDQLYSSTESAESVSDATSEVEIDAVTDMLGEDRLLKLAPRGWQKVPLPQDWPHGQNAWLVMRANVDRPVLATAPDGGAHQLVLYQPTQTEWIKSEHELDVLGLQLGVIENQLVLAQVMDASGQMLVHLHLLRSDELIGIGTEPLALPHTVAKGVRLVAVNPPFPVGILTWDDQEQLTLMQLNWQGDSAEPVVLGVDHSPPWTRAIDQFVMLAAFAVATLILFIFWRPGWNRVELPEGVRAADLSRRVAAAVIDMAPCLAVMMIGFDVAFHELHTHWPGHRGDRGDWQQTIPGALAIVLFVIHSGVTEIFTGRSLGKALLGLHVTNLTGKTPSIWQSVIRNFMKIFELISWFLLILPAVSQHRQRLGDLVARTLVVSEVGERSSVKDD